VDQGRAVANEFVGPPDEVVPAGFIRRWAALFLDSLILAIPLGVIAFIVAIPIGLAMADSELAGAMAQVVYYVFYFIVAPLYFAGMESSVHQATLGKQALGIKVTDDNGKRLSFGHALARWFAAALSYLTFFIGFLMAAFTERKRALHDMVAGTLVVDRWAYTDHPELQKRGPSGCLVAFVIAMLLVPVIAILAAIFISQYQDFSTRAQVQEAVELADRAKLAIANYYNDHGEYPISNEQAGLGPPSSISGVFVEQVDVGRVPGRIDATFSAQPPHKANWPLAGTRLMFTAQIADGNMSWHCHSDTIKQKWCPPSCECK
jgi:uncharacterized RDD family membrane protein YckC/type II secretory pathway pseudopilin PulG